MSTWMKLNMKAEILFLNVGLNNILCISKQCYSLGNGGWIKMKMQWQPLNQIQNYAIAYICIDDCWVFVLLWIASGEFQKLVKKKLLDLE